MFSDTSSINSPVKNPATVQRDDIRDRMFEEARRKAELGEDVSIDIYVYRIANERALIEIAKIAAAQNGAATSKYIQNYGIKDERALIEIAKIAAANDGLGTSEHIKNYGIKDERALIEIAKIAAAQSGYGTSKYIQNYGITDQQALVEIAKIAAANDGSGTSAHIQNYGIKDQEALREIATIALSNNIESLGQLDKYQLSGETLRSRVITPVLIGELRPDEFRRGLLERFKWLAAQEKIPRESVFNKNPPSNWSSLEPCERAAFMARRFAELYAEYIKRETPLDLSLEVVAEEVVYDALAATIAYYDKVEITRYQTRARATLALLSGYDSIPTGDLSPNSCRELWGVLTTARSIIGEDLARRLPVSLSNEYKARALRLLSLYTAIVGLKGEGPVFDKPIDSTDSFDGAETLLTEEVTKAFSERVLCGAVGQQGSVVRLWDMWGDLTPLIVLAGRYQANPAWAPEIPVLSEIARRCLDDSFHQWRYRREDNQLSMLSDEQLNGWKQNAHDISIVTVDAQDAHRAEASALTNIQNIFSTNLLVHLPREAASAVEQEP
jgi:hypothetical protein